MKCVFNDTFEYIYFLCKIQREFSPFAQASTSNANWRVPEARLELGGSLKLPLKQKITCRRRTDEQWTMVQNSDEDSKQ